jgi:DNA-binding beta-propeller fold protein YncE
MSLVTARSTTAPPPRAAWKLLLIAALTTALVAGLAIAGSRLLRQPDPTRLDGGLMVPVVSLAGTWDPTTVPGLSLPSGMDVGPDGNLYVVNAGANEILVLSPEGDVIRRWGERGSGEGQFIFQGDTQDPRHVFGGVAVTHEGRIYVRDTGNDRVQEFDLEGSFVKEWGGYGTEDGHFILGFDISDAPDGSLYVPDLGRGTLDHFDGEGAFLETVAREGRRSGALSDDFGGVFASGDGTLYLADGSGDAVLTWGADGHSQAIFGQDGPPDARLTYPYDVAADAEGNVYATEPARLVAFTPDGRLASTWDIPDADPTDGSNPIAIGPDGTIYVAVWHQDVIHRLRAVPEERESQSESDVASPSRAPLSSGAAMLDTSPLPSTGTFVVDAPFAKPFTALRPQGWKVNWVDAPGGVAMNTDRGGEVRVFVPVNAYADACESTEGQMDPPVGPSVDDLVEALTHVPGFRVVRPVTDIEIDGHQGKVFDLESTLILGDCPDDGLWLPLWTYQGADAETFAGPGSNFHQRIAVLDVGGTRVLVETWTFSDTPIEVIRQTEAVFESIDFE